MTKRIGNVVVFEAEPDRECQQCGKQAETRPYGPGGIRVCYECGMLDREGTERLMGAVLFDIHEEE